MKRDGGPAFPQHYCENCNDAFESPNGMTLRDYLAAHCPEFPHDDLSWGQVASARYAYADAMLVERERE